MKGQYKNKYIILFFLSVKGLLLASDYSLALLIPARWCTDGRAYGFIHTEKILPFKDRSAGGCPDRLTVLWCSCNFGVLFKIQG